MNLNKKCILIVGAGNSQYIAIQHARKLGYITISVDADKNAIGFNYSDYFYVGDIQSTAFLESVALKHSVNGILAISTDAPIPAIARVAEKLNLNSISVEGADISVNKLSQRLCLKNIGLTTPKFLSFLNIEELKEKINHISFPVVVKPADSSGSRGVSYVESHSEIINAAITALEYSKNQIGLIEEFIPGPEIAVDGFVIDGVMFLLCISEKERSNPPYLLDTAVHFPDNLGINLQKKVLKIARKALAACKINNSPFHMELILANDGPIMVEVAARGAGFNVFTKILPFVTGIDTIDFQIKLSVGDKINLKQFIRSNLKGASIHFLSPVPGIFKCLKNYEKLIKNESINELKIYIKDGDEMNLLRSGADRIGHLLVFSDNRKDAETKSKEIINQLKVVTY